MKKAIRNITLATIIGLSGIGCETSEPYYHPIVLGGQADIIDYLKWRGHTPCELSDDLDLDGDGVNDPYVRSVYSKIPLYHTKSRDPQPTDVRDIRWYLMRENNNDAEKK